MKKAMTQQMFIVLVVMLVVLSLLVFFVLNLRESGSSSVDHTLCKNSILSSNKLIKLNDDLDEIISQNPVNVFFENAKCESDLITIRNAKSGQAKYELANILTAWWGVFNNGKTPILQGSGSFCVVVADITLEGGPMVGFMDFLRTTNKPGSNKKYLDILSNGKPDDVLAKQRDERRDISSSEIRDAEYALVFSYIQGEDAESKTLTSYLETTFLRPSVTFFKGTMNNKKWSSALVLAHGDSHGCLRFES